MLQDEKINEIVRKVMDEIAGKKGEDAPAGAAASEASVLVPEPADREFLEYLKGTTPARIGVWRAGTRPLTSTLLKFRADHAVAQDAVFSFVDEKIPQSFQMLMTKSRVTDKDQYLTRPDMGRKLSDADAERVMQECPHSPQVQIVVADGLSAKAIEANIPDILPPFRQGLTARGVTFGRDIFVKFGRVGITDHIGEILKPECLVLFIGERPGLGTSESMSCYMTYRPGAGTIESARTVVSNIHKGGTPPAEAGALLVEIVQKILAEKVSGVGLRL